MNEINIYALSANPSTTENISALLRSEKYICLTGYYNSLNNGLKHLGKKETPLKENDILFIDDFSFNKSNTIKLLNSTSRSIVDNKTIIYTDSFDNRYVKDLSRLNINGILHKQKTKLFPVDLIQNETKQVKRQYTEKFISLIKSINQGIVCYDSLINSILLRKYAWARDLNEFEQIPGKAEERGKQNIPEILGYDSETVAAYIKNLTHREKEILLLIAQGKQNKTIANELNISIGTVEQHKEHIIKKKLKLKSTTELIIFAAKIETILKKLLDNSEK